MPHVFIMFYIILCIYWTNLLTRCTVLVSVYYVCALQKRPKCSEKSNFFYINSISPENFQKPLRPSFFDLTSYSGWFGDIFEKYLAEPDSGFHLRAPFAFLSIFVHIKV